MSNSTQDNVEKLTPMAEDSVIKLRAPDPAEECSLMKHARRELTAVGVDSPDADYGGALAASVLELLRVFCDQGHSGGSAPICVDLFRRLALYQPLGPLTGADDEWMEVTDGLFQNIRCSHVFKENGQAYDSHGKAFREPSGCCYLSRDSRVPVVFPYTPKTEYIDVPATVDKET